MIPPIANALDVIERNETSGRTGWMFGHRIDPITGVANQYHDGIDLGCPIGTPVFAVMDGTVLSMGTARMGGNYIQIEHDGDIAVTGYCHLSYVHAGLRPGTFVREGEIVAYTGNTGASTGPHLHFQMWRRGENKMRVGVDPLPLLKACIVERPDFTPVGGL